MCSRELETHCRTIGNVEEDVEVEKRGSMKIGLLFREMIHKFLIGCIDSAKTSLEASAFSHSLIFFQFPKTAVKHVNIEPEFSQDASHGDPHKTCAGAPQ
jgi:hypothetical protein